MLMYGRGIASPGNNRSLVISAVVMGTGLIIGLVSALVYYWDRAYKRPYVDKLEILKPLRAASSHPKIVRFNNAP
jgi:hypothetical protein